jgi:hypothetical protein
VASTADEAFSLLPSCCVTPLRPRDGLVSISWCGARRLSNTTCRLSSVTRAAGVVPSCNANGRTRTCTATAPPLPVTMLHGNLYE